ncbi:hypothetical protein J2Z60_000188 [Lactobacillus colini]|uniref:Uncharacterized protein n=1 Tax=Lactobacillus colini TaxID=1819254 RepID=A0ABS4MBJ4_9LACO|nr:hypothetical protein [Lactobacillus colini]MBP2057026.1 hypothetical protein [Lactobacillus colini]
MRLLQKLSNHPLHLLLGYIAICLGLILIFNDNYYFWPPYAAHFFNSDFVGAWGLFSGVGVTYVAAQSSFPIQANQVWLISLCGFFGFETGLELSHAIALADSHMLVTSLLFSGFLFLTFIAIRKDTHIKVKLEQRDEKMKEGRSKLKKIGF